MKEFYTVRIAAMFATNTNFQIWFCFTASFYTDTYQFPYTILVNGLERVIRKYLEIQVFGQKTTDIISAETATHLYQIVGAITEEIRYMRHQLCPDSSSRRFYHGAI